MGIEHCHERSHRIADQNDRPARFLLENLFQALEFRTDADRAMVEGTVPVTWQVENQHAIVTSKPWSHLSPSASVVARSVQENESRPVPPLPKNLST